MEEKVANSGNLSGASQEEENRTAGIGSWQEKGLFRKPSSRSGYALTREDSVRGALAANAQRRAKREARRKSALDLAHEAVEQQAERLLSAYWTAIDAGDWRAGEALQDRIYGRPTQRTETADVTPEREMSREELERLAKRHLRSLRPPGAEEDVA